MPKYSPINMPEITVEYDYQPEEWDHGYRVCPEDIEIDILFINGDRISVALEDHLIETYGDTWKGEIINGQRQRRLVGTI